MGQAGVLFGNVRKLDNSVTILVSSLLAVIAAVMMLRLGDGPHLKRDTAAPAFSARRILTSFSIPQFRASAFGYFGHVRSLRILHRAADAAGLQQHRTGRQSCDRGMGLRRDGHRRGRLRGRRHVEPALRQRARRRLHARLVGIAARCIL
jgi:hypothetical protein